MLTKSSLSNPQQRLLEALQKTNYGRIEGLRIHDGHPVFDPPPRILKDIKLAAGDSGARPESESADFVLRREHLELFDQLQRFGNGTIECLVVKAGLPFLLTLEQRG